MQAFIRTLLAGSLIAVSGATFANDRNQAALDACTQELQRFYGEEAAVKLVNARRAPGGVRLQLSTQVGEIVHCIVRSISFRQGSQFHCQQGAHLLPAWSVAVWEPHPAGKAAPSGRSPPTSP